MKNNRTPHSFLILGISFVTTLALISGVTLTHFQGFALLGSAHAMANVSSPTCATTKGKNPQLCEHQDPITQGCTTDTQTLEIEDALYQGEQIGEVDLRHSTSCGTYWVRTIAYQNTVGNIQAIHATVTFQNATHEDILIVPGSLPQNTEVLAYTDMTRSLNATPFGTGVFEIIGHANTPIIVPLTL